MGRHKRERQRPTWRSKTHVTNILLKFIISYSRMNSRLQRMGREGRRRTRCFPSAAPPGGNSSPEGPRGAPVSASATPTPSSERKGCAQETQPPGRWKPKGRSPTCSKRKPHHCERGRNSQWPLAARAGGRRRSPDKGVGARLLPCQPTPNPRQRQRSSCGRVDRGEGLALSRAGGSGLNMNLS